MRLDVDIKSGFFTSREVADGFGHQPTNLKKLQRRRAHTISQVQPT